ncbi:glycoside hydrolase family 2 protein [Wolffia australiana]
MAEEPTRKTKLEVGWLAARSTEVGLNGVELTTSRPPKSPPSPPWMEAAVPGTVLGTLLKNNLVPDPFYGMKNETIIDIADSGRGHYTFWFYTSFTVNLSSHQHLELNFRAINYSADLYLNGHRKVLPKGMFRRHSIDVSDILRPDGSNLLAVLVHPPDNPGRIPPEGGQGGDHEIGKDVAAQYVEGWDWMTPIRDRNTGIWDEVSIYLTGPVKIIDPHLVSSFHDDFKRAYLHSTAEFENKSSWAAECSVTFQVTADIEGNICLIENVLTQDIKIPPKSRHQHTFPPIFFYKPQLWWPNGMGQQYLYDVEIVVNVKGYGESDSWKNKFGFRKIESSIDPCTGGRLFKVNGQPVFVRGGNWVLSDGLLRLSKKRYETDIKFHADMNLNMIRCWGGGLAERPEFYHFCDLYGLMVWQEFWITGDCDGRGDPISNPDGPLDHDLFLTCATDTVKLLRNHASLALWVGGNEQTPPDDINKALKRELRLHPLFQTEPVDEEEAVDPSQYLDGSRVYVQGSMWDGFADGKGDFTDGPYEIQNPESFFSDDFYQFGFNPEIGSVGMPVAETVRATMPPDGWKLPLFNQLPSGYVEECPNPVWVYHKYIPYSKPGKVHDQILLYGEVTDLDDFCQKAQMVNYVQYRALLEGWNSKMWSKHTGVLIWKMQNPWTGLRGQLYDHLHDQTAGFFGCRHAAETVHVQLNLSSYFIEVVNNTGDELNGVAVEMSVWDLEGVCQYQRVTEHTSIPSKKVIKTVEMSYPKLAGRKPVYFLLLKLLSISDSRVLSRNFYWLHSAGGDFKLLEPYRRRRVPLEITSEVKVQGSLYKVKLQVRNASNSPSLSKLPTLFSLRKIIFGKKVVRINSVDPEPGVAFFIRFSVHRAEKGLDNGGDTRILPVHYSDNYLSLVPGESTAVDISFEVPHGVSPRIMLDGWNYPGKFSIV